MIISAAIVMNLSSDIVSEANLAGFYQEFGDYSDAVMYVFTIPVFPTKQEDGSTEYIISSSGKSYTVSDNLSSEAVIEAPIVAEDFDEIYGVDLDDEAVKTSPIYKKGLETK